MKALELHTGAPTVHWEDNTSCIHIVESKRFTPRVKHIYIPVYFLQEQFDYFFYVPKYYNSSVITADTCTKPWSGPIISQVTKCTTGFRLT